MMSRSIVHWIIFPSLKLPPIGSKCMMTVFQNCPYKYLYLPCRSRSNLPSLIMSMHHQSECMFPSLHCQTLLTSLQHQTVRTSLLPSISQWRSRRHLQTVRPSLLPSIGQWRSRRYLPSLTIVLMYLAILLTVQNLIISSKNQMSILHCIHG